MVLNGHGGNEFPLDWYSSVDPEEFFDEPGDHAGELETSVLMHLAPDRVLPLSEAGAGEERRDDSPVAAGGRTLPLHGPFRIAGLREGWVWAPRQWSEFSEDTGAGDPGAATAAKGARFFHAVTEQIGGFLAELAAADLDDLYGS